MKRKNRKRLAKEAQLAQNELRGDFSHLQDKKTGKFMAAPLPQPTFPQMSLRDEDLYTPAYPEQDAGSTRGTGMHKSSSGEGYAYPPSGNYIGAQTWDAGGVYGRAAGSQMRQQVSSDTDTDILHGYKTEYAESTYSNGNDLVYGVNGAGYGGDIAFGESSVGLTAAAARPGFSTVPSYQSHVAEYSHTRSGKEQYGGHYRQQTSHEQFDPLQYEYVNEDRSTPLSRQPTRNFSQGYPAYSHQSSTAQSQIYQPQYSSDPSYSVEERAHHRAEIDRGDWGDERREYSYEPGQEQALHYYEQSTPRKRDSQPARR